MRLLYRKGRREIWKVVLGREGKESTTELHCKAVEEGNWKAVEEGTKGRDC